MPNKVAFRLLTNINFISVKSHPLRLRCCALVLSNDQIRGFHADSSMEVFTHWPKCDPKEYEIRATSNPNFVMATDSGERPLFSGYHLTFKDGTELITNSKDPSSPLEVTDYDEPRKMWKELPLRVLSHWRAPGFPVVAHLQKDQVPSFLRSMPG